MKRVGIVEKIIRSLIYGRFDPVETLISIFMIMMGTWLVAQETYRDTSTRFFGSGTTLAITALVFILLGVAHLVSIHFSVNGHSRWFRIRANALFVMVMAMFFASLEVILNGGLISTRWLPWVFLTLIGAVSYLSLVVKR